jgi:pimeloyl-ACP methyl ester carboxylesterase
MKIAYRQCGQGPTVLFIHGFCENKDLWLAFEKHLSAAYQTIAIDLPGFGESRDNAHYRSVEEMAREVEILLEELQIERCVVIGHSLGGYVALALADLYPHLINGLCLFHSTAYADSEEKKRTRDKTALFIEKNGLKPFLENFVPSVFYDGRKQELASATEAYFEMTRQTPVITAVAVTKAMRDRPDRSHVLAEAKYPVLFIVGKDDTAVPLESSREQFFLPSHGTVHLLARTAHMGMIERPEETLMIVENFLNLIQVSSF